VTMDANHIIWGLDGLERLYYTENPTLSFNTSPMRWRSGKSFTPGFENISFSCQENVITQVTRVYCDLSDDTLLIYPKGNEYILEYE